MRKLFSSLGKILQRPFPLMGATTHSALAISFGVGIFITVFLIAFPPLDLGSHVVPEIYFFASVYGLICCLVVLFNFFVIPHLFPRIFVEEGWTIGKHLGYCLWEAITIGLGNICYSVLQFELSLSIFTIWIFLGITLLIGIFPTLFITLLLERHLLQRNISEANRIAEYLHLTQLQDKIQTDSHSISNDLFSDNFHHPEKPLPTIILEGTGAKERFESLPNTIVCLQANGNYVTIYYLNDNKECKAEMLRMTLKSAETITTAYSHIIRCHKSYIVNLEYVNNITGYAQGYKLHIPTLDFLIPVSRNFQDQVLHALGR